MSSIDNYLPACTSCNRLRWGREGEKLRDVLLIGSASTAARAILSSEP
jgi:hypothetical protein